MTKRKPTWQARIQQIIDELMPQDYNRGVRDGLYHDVVHRIEIAAREPPPCPWFEEGAGPQFGKRKRKR